MSCGRESVIVCAGVGVPVVTVGTGEGTGDETGATGVAWVVTPWVTAGCAGCWPRQPEQKSRIKQVAVMTMRDMFLMIFP